MKATNEQVRIQLQNTVDREFYTFRFVDHAVPAQSYMGIRIDELQQKYNKLVKEHEVPKLDDGRVSFKDIEDEDLVRQLVDIQNKILKTDMNRVCAIIDLEDELPDGYANQRELIEDCIGDHSVMPKLLSVFMERSGNIISSPGRGTNPIRFLRPNGQEYDPFKEKNTEKAKEQDSA